MCRRAPSVEEVLEVIIYNFLIPLSKDSSRLEDVENYVVSSLHRRFGFTKNSASRLFFPCYWYLCLDKEYSLFSLKAHPEVDSSQYGGRGSIYYIEKLRKGLRSDEIVGGIIRRYGETLSKRLELAEYCDANS